MERLATRVQIDAGSMSGKLVFRGVAHPPAKKSRDWHADLNAGELLTAQGERLNGLPVHVEHDTNAPAVGNVLAAYQGPRGELKVVATVDDAQVAARVKDGSLRGLSLGTECIQDMDGNTLSRSQREVSLCEEGRRAGTWITHINDRPVHEVACFSKRASGTSRYRITCLLPTTDVRQTRRWTPLPPP